MKRLFGPALAVLSVMSTAPCAAGDDDAPASSVVLVTLDTTRADAVGCYGGDARTPNLDGLARGGARFARAVTPSPLTLPAHATILTGVDPPEHGVRSNGSSALCGELPTLASVLAVRGFATAAFVSSRVLDRRFGLDRGFAVYDDTMAAERIGEYGYPERSATEVTDAALAWLSGRDPSVRFLLWVHYYDPHAPYRPPPELGGDSPRAAYAGEIAYVDRELGRLLAALPADTVVAAVGDHGEMLGEHGERTHGVFLYRGSLEVPLILRGPGVPKAAVVKGPVSIRRLPATLLGLLGVEGPGALPGPSLLADGAEDAGRPAVYSEATLPATAYGWSGLASVTDGDWRYVDAPRPELYDLAGDPSETRNLVVDRAERADGLREVLHELAAREPLCEATAAVVDAATRAALHSLGYVAGADTDAGDAIDPKDGVGMLAEAEVAALQLRRGEADGAVATMSRLVAANPHNLPFQTQLAESLLAAGHDDRALAVFRQAVELDSRSEFLRLNLAHALRGLGRIDEARREYLSVLDIDPRSAPAWLWLVETAPEAEKPEMLRRAVAADTDSITLLLRLAALERDADRPQQATDLLERATRLAPHSAAVWLASAELAEHRGELEVALSRCGLAAQAEPANPAAALCTGRVYLLRGDLRRARANLRRAAVLDENGEIGAEAERLLAESTE